MSRIVRLADSPEDRLASWKIREQVFIREQGIDESLERDDLDGIAWHFVAWVDGAPVGTVRVFGVDAAHRPIAPAGASTVKVGRMAVLADRRRLGIGRLLLDAALDHARLHGSDSAELSAQEHVVPFYARAGFLVEGGRYLEAAIPHRQMARRL